MLSYRFAICLLLCYLSVAHSRKRPVVNRLTCQNVFTAHDNDSVDECANEWSSSPWVQHGEDSTIYCKLCKDTVSFPWERKLPPLLCNFWRDPSECDRVFTALSKLTYRKDRDVVLCNVLTICNSHSYIKDLDFGSDLCSDCKKIIQDVKQLISDNATSDEITRKLDEYVCANLPGGVKDYCENMVKVHVPAFLHLIDANIDPMTICSIVGLCSEKRTNIKLRDFMDAPKIDPFTKPECLGKCPKQSSYSWISRPTIPDNHKWTSKSSGGVPTCDMCKDVFKQVQSVLQDPTMQSEIKVIIDDKICANMGFLKQECKALVNNNFDTILNALLQLDPQEACAIFKMCTKTPSHVIFNPLFKITNVDIPIPGVCKFCEVIVRKLFDMFAANQTEKSLYEGMMAMCDVLPSQYKTQCTDFVKKYGVQIVKAIVEGTAPALICASFGLCSESPIPILSMIVSTHLASDLCIPCKFAVETLKLELRDNKTVDQIRTSLDQVCGLLPAQYTEQCKSFINHNFDELLASLLQLNAQEVCVVLKLCPSTRSHSSTFGGQPRINIGALGGCRFCDITIRKLIDMLGANHIDQMLHTGMTAMCQSLKYDRKSRCTEFVKAYGVPIVRTIVGSTAPAIICSNLGGCSAPPARIFNLISPSQMTVDFCTPCKFAVETIYLQLRNNKTEEEIRTALDQVCGLLPAQYTDECKEYMNAYLDIVIQYMENNLTPEQVCQLLKLCPESRTESLSEGNPCLLGPDYWCANHMTAKRCGAIHYCQNFHRRIYRYPHQNPLTDEPHGLCKFLNLSSICINFDLAKQCQRVQECLAFKLKHYFDILFEPFEPVENCSVCEQIAIRWRLQSRILGGPIVNSSVCSTYGAGKKRQCQRVHENQDQILKAIRLGKEEPEQICARFIGCKPLPTPTKPTDKDILYPEGFYDKSFKPLKRSTPTPMEAVNYLDSLDKTIKAEQSPSNVPLETIKGPLVGIDPCTWGPSFWCLSYENAKKCPQALEHCQTKVWTDGIPPPPLPPVEVDPTPSGPKKPTAHVPGSTHIIHCCKSAHSARLCGPEALRFCMQHVWSNMGKNMAN